MDLRKGKKGLIIKTWERCTSFGSRKNWSSSRSGRLLAANQLKSKSWPRSNTLEEDQDVSLGDCRSTTTSRGGGVVPVGCFSVYVGCEKQRFVVKTDCLNHPLFMKLLEEAETEYGFKRDGPLELPCEVDHFLKVLLEMDCDYVRPILCSFRKSYSSYHLLTSSKLFSTLNNN